MSDHEQRLEMHKDATRVSQAHPSEIGTEWSTWRTLRNARNAVFFTTPGRRTCGFPDSLFT
jgi:hypothetical protein